MDALSDFSSDGGEDLFDPFVSFPSASDTDTFLTRFVSF
jgi:hypothetical protein